MGSVESFHAGWVVCNHSQPGCGYCRHAIPHSTVTYRDEDEDVKNCEEQDFCPYVGCKVHCVPAETVNDSHQIAV